MAYKNFDGYFRVFLKLIRLVDERAGDSVGYFIWMSWIYFFKHL